MGEVYDAVHVADGRRAAVKLLQADMLRHADSIRRFLREAQIAASLSSHHVVAVYEIGGIEAATPFIAMERLEGYDLAEHLRQNERLPLRAVAKMAREVARGLEAAHEAGIVHRDLKPANLFHAKREDDKLAWKILDFGVSKLVGTLQGTLTKENALVGTPEYMAPEQPMGGAITRRTDVYALGVICYRALTGRPAFTGEGLMDTVYAVVNRMPPRPTEVVPSLPEAVDSVLAVAMAKAPEDRFAEAGELAEALYAAYRGSLDDALRRRAEAVAEKCPWGSGA
jgi:serine/threonine-protein kinase